MPRVFLMSLLAFSCVLAVADQPSAQALDGQAKSMLVEIDPATHGALLQKIEKLVTVNEGATPPRKGPFLGVVTTQVSAAVRAQTDLGEGIGLLVEAVAPDSPATKAGLQEFDILARYDDQILCATKQLAALVKRTGLGKPATLTVIRRGKELPIAITVGEGIVADAHSEQPTIMVLGPYSLDGGDHAAAVSAKTLEGKGDDGGAAALGGIKLLIDPKHAPAPQTPAPARR
ncbi:MAG: PDZ domain-containing protein [Planctomycetia bacterium]